MKKYRGILVLTWFLLFALLTGCGGVAETDFVSDTDTETDTEAGIVTETEAEPIRETEAEAESESETERETETETEPETETELETEPEQPLVEPAVLWEENGAVLRLYNEASGARAVLYKAPDAGFLGDAYAVELSLDGETWYPLDVWTARVAVQIASSVYDLYTTNFVNFDVEGQAFLRVTPRADGAVKIRPEGWVRSAAAGDATVIRITEACQLSLEVGGDLYRNLQIFANPIEVVDKTDPDIIYLEAGLYTAENCDLITCSVSTDNGVEVYTPVLHVPAGKTLYLSGGAVVQAMIHFDTVEDASVRGRGVIDHYLWNRANNIRASEPKPSPAGIRVENSKNITVEGVIVRNSQAYSIYAGNTAGLTVDNFKCISAAQWSDGFDAMATSDVVIKNSFFRTNDDCIAIYGSRWNNKGDSRNYEIYDCILWADNAHAINMGNHGSNDASNSDIIENIYFHDIEILEVHSINWTGAFSVMCGGENILRNVTLERFNVEFTKSDLIRLRFTMDAEHYGFSLENFTFRDIYFIPREGQKAGVYLEGLNKWRSIKGVVFENVYVGNEKLTARSSAFHKNEYVTNFTFR